MNKKLAVTMTWSIVLMIFIAILFALIGYEEAISACLLIAFSIGVTIIILAFFLKK